MGTLGILIANLLAIAALFWLFDTAYRSYRLDLLRFYIFRARDNLFAAAEKGVISFSHPAYGMTRQTLNGMIRFAHELGFWRGVILFMSRRLIDGPSIESERFWREYGAAIKSLPLHARREVLRAGVEAHLAVFSYLVHTSLLLFPIVFVGKWIFRGVLRMRRTARLAQRAIPADAKLMLDHHAYECGA